MSCSKRRRTGLYLTAADGSDGGGVHGKVGKGGGGVHSCD